MPLTHTHRTIAIVLIIAAMIILSLITFSWWAGKHLAELAYEATSPKGYYRVEVWEASDFSFQALPKEFPGFVRVYDNRKNKLIYESDILELTGNGDISFPYPSLPKIIVGYQVFIDVEPEPE